MRTVNEWIDWAAGRLEEAGVHFGHGTDNSRDEAAWLVLHAIGASPTGNSVAWEETVEAPDAAAIRNLVDARIAQRCPTAYLTGTGWFAGLEFEVSPDVLVPRSPIAELIAEGFSPWMDEARVHSILDLGTGCGCIAIACAIAFPQATVTGSDISEAALAIARRNARRHGVDERVRFQVSNVYDSLGDGKYDLIVTNPPYVPTRAVAALPAEYRAEPSLGLVSGRDGLDIPLQILEGASDHIAADGVLICEVGESAERLQAALPGVPFLWLEFASGGSGVFMLERAQLVEAGKAASELLRKRESVT